MRLIDADSIPWDVDGVGEIPVITKEEINAMPTVEAVPVRHGKWIPVTNGRGGFECNQCHCYAPSYQDGVEWLSAFCPNCGARMDAEREDNG